MDCKKYNTHIVENLLYQELEIKPGDQMTNELIKEGKHNTKNKVQTSKVSAVMCACLHTILIETIESIPQGPKSSPKPILLTAYQCQNLARSLCRVEQQQQRRQGDYI